MCVCVFSLIVLPNTPKQQHHDHKADFTSILLRGSSLFIPIDEINSIIQR